MSKDWKQSFFGYTAKIIKFFISFIKMLIDAHTHLNESRLFEKREEYVKLFEEQDGKILINSWANPFYNEKGIEIAKESEKKFPHLTVKSTVGFHPCDIPEDIEQQIQEIENLYLQNKEHVIAIGECGIDLHFPDSPSLSLQQKGFKAQAELARKYQLPLVIHSRDAFDETFEILQEFKDLKIYIHSWAYDKESLKKVENLIPQLRIGINNMITYPSAKIAREAILSLSSAKLLMETDAPYLPPQTKRGEINLPSYVSYVYEKYAERTGISKEELEEKILNNVKELFSLQ